MVDMVENIMEAARTVTRTADIVKDYEGLRAQFNNVLDLLLPGDGNDLLPLHGQDWPALKDEVTGWMEGQVYDRRLRQTFGSGVREGGRRGRAPPRRLLVGHRHPGRDRPG